MKPTKNSRVLRATEALAADAAKELAKRKNRVSAKLDGNIPTIHTSEIERGADFLVDVARERHTKLGVKYDEKHYSALREHIKKEMLDDLATKPANTYHDEGYSFTANTNNVRLNRAVRSAVLKSNPFTRTLTLRMGPGYAEFAEGTGKNKEFKPIPPSQGKIGGVRANVR